ncbi:MAG TPA: pirin family protein [Rhizomicrobium sp.]|nr:pirin family protein [Rhizomicrobium sp.]
MLTLRKSGDRGKTTSTWLQSRHSFSFAAYHDPQNMGFGPLRVINEDVIAGGGGFSPHSHRDMEIVTYVLSGVLQHRDSLGTGSVIHPGEIQKMSAGHGIVHSEFNVSRENACHLLQIWIQPSKAGITPAYEQKTVDPKAIKNHFARIAAPDPRDNEVTLVQDAEIWAARFEDGVEDVRVLEQGRRAWLQVASGDLDVCGHRLTAGDGISITDEDRILVRAHAPSEALLFDMA